LDFGNKPIAMKLSWSLCRANSYPPSPIEEAETWRCSAQLLHAVITLADWHCCIVFGWFVPVEGSINWRLTVGGALADRQLDFLAGQGLLGRCCCHGRWLLQSPWNSRNRHRRRCSSLTKIDSLFLLRRRVIVKSVGGVKVVHDVVTAGNGRIFPRSVRLWSEMLVRKLDDDG
jgi:hypothetical protein